MNLDEALTKKTALQHKAAVFEELGDYLGQFLPSDLGSAEAILEVEDCMVSTVDYSAVEDVLSMLVGEQQKLSKELNALAKLRVTNVKKKK